MLPRSQRMPEFKLWKRENIAGLLDEKFSRLLSKHSRAV